MMPGRKGEAPEVALLRWPADDATRRELAAARRPRILLIDPGVSLPTDLDHMEDWLRYPVDAEELAARSEALAMRCRHVRPRPVGLVLDGEILRSPDGRWVVLPPVEGRVFASLLDRAGEVVRRPALTAVGWPDRRPADPRAVDGVVRRLRHRVAPLGVAIETVPGGGFLLDHVAL
jgi:DNA-binding response OmpR family regulator